MANPLFVCRCGGFNGHRIADGRTHLAAAAGGSMGIAQQSGKFIYQRPWELTHLAVAEDGSMGMA